MTTTLFFNCVGHDLPDYSRKSFDSFVVADGKVLIADFDLATSPRFAHANRRNLGGNHVFAAFADAHTHFLQTGLVAQGCNLTAATSISGVLELLAQYSRTCEFDWVLGFNLDETRLSEGRLPTRRELDKAVPGKNLWVSRIDLHSALPNSAALAWCGKRIPDAKPDQERFAGPAYYRLWPEITRGLPPAMKRKALESAREACFRRGVGAVHALEGSDGPDDPDVELVADFFSREYLHGVVYPQTFDYESVIRRRWNRIGGCLLMDGSFGSRTAALSAPYADDPSASGTLLTPSDRLERFLDRCYKYGLQTAMHAIGDRAISILAAAHADIIKDYGPQTLPHRIEHFELPDKLSLRAAKDAGLFISVQPAFEMLWGGPDGMYARRLGRERAALTNPFKTIMHYGLTIAGGSDSPVTPIDPLFGIYAFLNHPTPDERIDLNAALAAFITEPHRFAGEEKTRGRLKEGYWADFVCLDRDPFAVPPARFMEITIARLFLKGIPVFEKG